MKKLNKKNRTNAGMSYVELIVVLSIFSAMSSIVMFNYGGFQAKVDIKNLASDIALQIVQAQKSSLSGLLPTQAPNVSPWKPSYGTYFDLSNNKSFIYFADFNNLNGYEAGEALNTINIQKNNYIFGIDRCNGVACVPSVPISPLSIIFKRTDSGAIFKDSSGTTLTNNFDYIQITIKSPQSMTAVIKLYPSGRVQIN